MPRFPPLEELESFESQIGGQLDIVGWFQHWDHKIISDPLLILCPQDDPGNPIILQIHGFARDNHPDYPQVVLGAGKKIEGPEITCIKNLSEALIARGISVGVCDGKSWQDLCGTENLQAFVITNGVFIHIELDEKMRKNDEDLIATLIQTLGN